MLEIFKKKKSKRVVVNPENVQQHNQKGQQNDDEVSLEEAQEIVADLKEKAASGDVVSMQWLGDIYFKGQGGIPQSNEMTLKYWKMAADHGHIDLAFKTGLLYGQLQIPDYENQYFYVKKAADLGNENAMYVLYKLLLAGLGCSSNMELAYQYLKMAAACGNKAAMMELSE